jgi:hypothetical protein
MEASFQGLSLTSLSVVCCPWSVAIEAHFTRRVASCLSLDSTCSKPYAFTQRTTDNGQLTIRVRLALRVNGVNP